MALAVATDDAAGGRAATVCSSRSSLGLKLQTHHWKVPEEQLDVLEVWMLGQPEGRLGTLTPA